MIHQNAKLFLCHPRLLAPEFIIAGFLLKFTPYSGAGWKRQAAVHVFAFYIVALIFNL